MQFFIQYIPFRASRSADDVCICKSGKRHSRVCRELEHLACASEARRHEMRSCDKKSLSEVVWRQLTRSGEGDAMVFPW